MQLRSTVICAFLTIVCLGNAKADDIDIYTSQFANQHKPNVLFVLDYSYSMASDVLGGDPAVSGLPSKLDILKTALGNALDANLDVINAGIGSVIRNSASGNRWPVTELNADANTVDPEIPAGTYTVRDILGTEINNRGANGETATVPALAEAALYLRGGPVLHDGSNPLVPSQHKPDRWDNTAGEYRGGASTASLRISYTPSDTAYAEGVNEPGNFGHCDYALDRSWDNCVGLATYDCEDYTTTGVGTNGDGQTYNYGGFGRCKVPHPDAWRGAQYVSPITQSCQATAIVLVTDGIPTNRIGSTVLQETMGYDDSSCEDLSVSVFNSTPGGYTEGNCGPEIVRYLANNDQIPTISGSTVKTYTVGFDIDGPGKRYLQRLAAEGDGSFFEASQAEELNTAIRSAINQIAGGSQTFSPFSIDINRATLSHDNKAYFNLFSPNSGPSWSGNLKGYFIGENGLLDTLNQPAVEVSVDGKVQFAETARSFWSSDVDGNDVMKGGASEFITAQTGRKLLTYVGSSIPAAGVDLGVSANYELSAANMLITDAMLGLPASSPLRQSSLDWLQSAPMGDPLHTMSVRVQYANRLVVYTMTNQGLIHAIDASDPVGFNDHSVGTELFAFMPKRLLRNLPVLSGSVPSSDHVYGLDGALTRWHDDTNNDGFVNNGEQVLLVFGMRRGGDAYFALDVSNPLSPSLEWQIDATTPGFSALAQSWSRASLVTVNNSGSMERMLVFGGGYDAATLDGTNTPTNSSGNAIYMVDKQGNLRWSVTSADHSSLRYAIASDLTVIDSDSDGDADRLYVGDIGGQVWRVDFDDISDAPVVARLADFSSSGFHPFFYPPSVARSRSEGDSFLSVSLGSGNRTDPLNNSSQNRFFMIRDMNLLPLESGSIPAPVLMSDLYDTTDNNIGSTNTSVAEAARALLDNAQGWTIRLPNGEKSLSALVTFEDTIMATTFSAAVAQTDPCKFSSQSRLYTMNLTTGEPVSYGTDGARLDSTGNTAIRHTELQEEGIPSSPVIIFRPNSGLADIYVGKEKTSVVDGLLRTIYWHAR